MGVEEKTDQKAFIFCEKEFKKDDADFVKKCIISLSKIVNPINIRLISEKINYDSYYFESDGESYCIKISLDPSCAQLLNEIKFYKNSNLQITPKFFLGGKTKKFDNITYLITSYENSASIKEFGANFFIENFESFCHSYSLLSKADNKNTYSPRNKNSFFEKSDLKFYFGEETFSLMREDFNFEFVSMFLNFLFEKLKALMDQKFDHEFVCHGNLKSTNIICRNGLIKFINFENLHKDHCFIDFSSIIIDLLISKKQERELLDIFCQHLKIDLDEKNIEIYINCYQIVLVKKFIMIFMTYLEENHLFEGSRTIKIFENSVSFQNLFYRFYELDGVEPYQKQIYDTIVNSINFKNII